MAWFEANDIHKTYRLGKVRVPVLRGASLHVNRGEWVAILGASGSGKSTLLHILGGLDRPDAGSVSFDGIDVTGLGARRLDQYRNQSVGFVFQFYHLLPELTVLENTMLAAMIRYGRFGMRREGKDLQNRAAELLDTFGLSGRLAHRPAELSGGERQRVAIARALMNDPPVLLADEPTGNLDQKTGEGILDSVTAHREQSGRTVVMVTHDVRVAARADRVVSLVDGQMQSTDSASLLGVGGGQLGIQQAETHSGEVAPVVFGGGKIVSDDPETPL